MRGCYQALVTTLSRLKNDHIENIINEIRETYYDLNTTEWRDIANLIASSPKLTYFYFAYLNGRGHVMSCISEVIIGELMKNNIESIPSRVANIDAINISYDVSDVLENVFSRANFWRSFRHIVRSYEFEQITSMYLGDFHDDSMCIVYSFTDVLKILIKDSIMNRINSFNDDYIPCEVQAVDSIAERIIVAVGDLYDNIRCRGFYHPEMVAKFIDRDYILSNILNGRYKYEWYDISIIEDEIADAIMLVIKSVLFDYLYDLVYKNQQSSVYELHSILHINQKYKNIINALKKLEDDVLYGKNHKI